MWVFDILLEKIMTAYILNILQYIEEVSNDYEGCYSLDFICSILNELKETIEIGELYIQRYKLRQELSSNNKFGKIIDEQLLVHRFQTEMNRLADIFLTRKSELFGDTK